ncbi:MAG: phenylalanine--tRNA ligase subunit alpha [Candidatus Cloacimonadota bacterium]|nr:phenylalanine--tRNA ligase subunit alpha [Candidatus Cloacimonadota bacterium]
MKEEIQILRQKALEEIPNCKNLKELEGLRIKFLGRKSKLSSLLGQIGRLSNEQRPIIGDLLNQTKKEIEKLIRVRKEALLIIKQKKSKTKPEIDITLPGRPIETGAKHPLFQVWEEIEDIFISLGFEIAEGPEIESEYYNFDALNTPEWHPARNLSDTFYLKNGMLLRTETSPVQIRVMEKYKPPIRIIAPGRCYRNDKPDASHSPVFHQFEALVVGVGITFVDLKSTLDSFVKRFFGEKTHSRFRPHFFPFTEPSAEIDILCINCGGKGCKLCKNTGWLEMGGAGMVDPKVLEEVKYDSEKYTGFAFGLGIDRITMLRYGISDIRMLFKNDLRFLRQFV